MKEQYTYQEAIDKLLDLWEAGTPSDQQIATLCEEYPEAAEEIERMVLTWDKLPQDIPEPSSEMHANFYKMLNEESRLAQDKMNMWRTGNRSYVRWGLIAAAIFFIGLTFGLLAPFNLHSPQSKEKITTVVVEKGVSETYAALTNEHSALERLRGTQLSRELPELDEHIIHALHQTLLNDPNVNVRLGAIETMVQFADDPRVRQFLISAIPHQVSPLVQLSLAKVMVEWQEKSAIEEIRALIEAEHVEMEVKMELEETLETLM